MDVFKIHVGEGRAIAISRENYFMETKGMEPYVVERDGHRTFYAVCPECDNPIQLIGLNRRELDAGHRRRMENTSGMTCLEWPYMTRRRIWNARIRIRDIIVTPVRVVPRPIPRHWPCTGS